MQRAMHVAVPVYPSRDSVCPRLYFFLPCSKAESWAAGYCIFASHVPRRGICVSRSSEFSSNTLGSGIRSSANRTSNQIFRFRVEFGSKRPDYALPSQDVSIQGWSNFLSHLKMGQGSFGPRRNLALCWTCPLDSRLVTLWCHEELRTEFESGFREFETSFSRLLSDSHF